jgi:two-component system sensor histidine kinase UhpB
MKTPIRIVMLEDSDVDAEIITRFLKKEKVDFQSQLASNRTAFMSALDQFEPDVVLADNSLPQFNGAEALQAVRQKSRYIPFILVTGSMTDEFAADIIKSGADDYILKDRLTRLPGAIDAAIRKHRTEKEKLDAMTKLVQSEAKYRSLLESAPDALVIVNNEGLIQLVNIETERMFGYNAHQLGGVHIRTLLAERYRQSPLIDQVETLDTTRMAESFELFAIKKDGTEFPVEVRLSPFTTSEGTLTTAAIRDVTERKAAETALKVMEQEIMNQKIQEQKKIARAIIKAQEKERNRIGQELHDNVNQMLVGTKLYLEMAGDEDLDVQQIIKSSLDMIQQSINEIRALSARNVTPLKNINLQQLLQSLVERTNVTGGITMSLTYEAANIDPDDDLKLNIYRIAQEQLNNILKHAQAKNGYINVSSDGKNILVAIGDEGKGFDVSRHRKGIGISNMINRVESFNGEVHIDSSPGKGTKMHITLPL